MADQTSDRVVRRSSRLLMEVVMLVRRQVLPTALVLIALSALVLMLFNSASEAQTPASSAPVTHVIRAASGYLVKDVVLGPLEKRSVGDLVVKGYSQVAFVYSSDAPDNEDAVRWTLTPYEADGTTVARYTSAAGAQNSGALTSGYDKFRVVLSNDSDKPNKIRLSYFLSSP
jgi:hypothetical protein